MLTDCRISFIGSGAMAEAMIRGLLAQRLIDPGLITASDPRRARALELAERYGVRGVTDNLAAVRNAGIIVLSVKPQVLPEVLAELAGQTAPENLVLSIVAGMRISVIKRALGCDAIVRAMPNTPAQVGEGMTVWTATVGVGERHLCQAQAILAALGKEIRVEDEGYLDMATALSGTGPAYVFLFMEALIDAGVHMGFSRRIAQELVLQTISGSVAVARATGMHPTELRNGVTSPGGTSAEALYQLEKGGLRTVISKAVWAAYQRSKSLGESGEK